RGLECPYTPSVPDGFKQLHSVLSSGLYDTMFKVDKDNGVCYHAWCVSDAQPEDMSQEAARGH
ncbi:hypothetical protein ACFLTL_02855, partial [Chloroflexota bacterium]